MMDLGRAYFDQYGFRSVFGLLGNLYGPGDTLDAGRAHVVAALIMRCLSARTSSRSGGGSRATREHLFVEDAADGLLALARYDSPDPLNIGTGREVSVAEARSGDRPGHRV